VRRTRARVTDWPQRAGWSGRRSPSGSGPAVQAVWILGACTVRQEERLRRGLVEKSEQLSVGHSTRRAMAGGSRTSGAHDQDPDPAMSRPAHRPIHDHACKVSRLTVAQVS
jgi:hypothetical protein